MLFTDIIGQEHLKEHLKSTVDNGRVAHAQLFVGESGAGVLAFAIAYAQYLLTSTAKDVEACQRKCEALAHPDLHFSYPVTTTQAVKRHPISTDFIKDWRSFVAEKPYGDAFEWLQHIGAENKQGNIGVDEAESIVKRLLLKPFEGGFKVMIIWMAEKMNIAASNKLLKLIEEPPANTVFLFLAEKEEQLIQTIRSRCQVLHFPKLATATIKNALIQEKSVGEHTAIKIAQQSQGNYNKALHILAEDSQDILFEEWFIQWIRTAFRAKGNAAVIQDLIKWSQQIADTGREMQKKFLHYCIDFFRQALLLNYASDDLVYFEAHSTSFKLEKFAPFVHGDNIQDIFEALDTALYHIERNGNAKIILLDLSMQLTRFLHKKQTPLNEQ